MEVASDFRYTYTDIYVLIQYVYNIKISTYAHTGDQHGVLVEVAGDFRDREQQVRYGYIDC